MKISVLTLGCKVNQAESALLEGDLRKQGIEVVSLSEHPDFCIINTCTVTAKSDYQSRQLTRRAIKAGAKIIVTGCYAHIRPEEILMIDRSARIVSNSDKINIINMISNYNASTGFVSSGRSRPFIKVQDGCNNACTYCIVPRARGRSKSIQIHEVIRQILECEDAGYHEIVLTGVHLGLYGLDISPKTDLSHLLDAIRKNTKIARIRLSSLELNEFTDAILEQIQDPRICKHLHIPLQSGDDSILRKMNRHYTLKEYRDIIEKIKKRTPDIAIGTDVIVGFPGEGDMEFENTKNYLDDLPFSYLHIFPFSSRPGTKASKMPLQIPLKVKKRRSYELKLIHSLKKNAYMRTQLHKTLDVIIEDKVCDDCFTGTTGNYLKIRLSGNNLSRQSLVYVRVAGIEENTLVGIPIRNT